MRLKLNRTLGIPLIKKLGLANKDPNQPNAAYTENSVIEVDKDVADQLLKDNLATETTEPVGPAPVPFQGVPPVAGLQAVPPAPTNPSDFNRRDANQATQGDGSNAPGVSEAEEALKSKKK